MKRIALLSSAALMLHATTGVQAASIDDIYLSTGSGAIYKLNPDTLAIQASGSLTQDFSSGTYLGIQSNGNLVAATGTNVAHVNQDTLGVSGFTAIPNTNGTAEQVVTGLGILSDDRVAIVVGSTPSTSPERIQSLNSTTFAQDVFVGNVTSFKSGIGPNVQGKLHVDSLDRAVYGLQNAAGRASFTQPSGELEVSNGLGMTGPTTVRTNNGQVVYSRTGQFQELRFFSSLDPTVQDFAREQMFGRFADDIVAFESLRGASDNLMALGTSGGRVGIYDPENSVLLASITGLAGIEGLVVQSDNDIVAYDNAGNVHLLRQVGSTLVDQVTPVFVGSNLSDIVVQTAIPEPAGLVLLGLGAVLTTRRRR